MAYYSAVPAQYPVQYPVQYGYPTMPEAPPAQGWSVWAVLGGVLLNSFIGTIVILGILLWHMWTSVDDQSKAFDKDPAKDKVNDGGIGAALLGLGDLYIGSYAILPVALVVTIVCAFSKVSFGHSVLWNALASAVAAAVVIFAVRPTT